MAKNVVRTRDEGTILITNGAAAKAAGQLVVSGENVCLLKADAAANQANCPAFVDQVDVKYAKLTTDVVAEGAQLYLDATNNWLTITASTHKKAGTAAAAAGNGVTEVVTHLGLNRL